MTLSPAQQRFQTAISCPDAQIDLAYAALCIAQEAYPDLEPQIYLDALKTMAAEIELRLAPERYPLRVIQTINQYLFDELGFRGNEHNYYDPRNSFLNDVIDQRIGIPITLALVYLEVAQQLGFPMEGIGMPGHFLIRPKVEDMEIYVDTFNQGITLFPQDCEERLQQIYGSSAKLESDYLTPVRNTEFLIRMLTNLKMIYFNYRDAHRALATIDFILLLAPEQLYERRDRGLILHQLERWQEARSDLEAYLAGVPAAQDRWMIRQLLKKIQE